MHGRVLGAVVGIPVKIRPIVSLAAGPPTRVFFGEHRTTVRVHYTLRRRCLSWVKVGRNSVRDMFRWPISSGKLLDELAFALGHSQPDYYGRPPIEAALSVWCACTDGITC